MQILRSIGITEARTLIDGARHRAHQIGVPMCIAVADHAGILIAFLREDAAKPTSVSIAIDKAFTAAGARNPTSFYARASQPGAPAWGIDKTNGGHFTVIGGGAPILEDGVVVGGIGISGGTSAQDEDVALAAVAALGSVDPDLSTAGVS